MISGSFSSRKSVMKNTDKSTWQEQCSWRSRIHTAKYCVLSMYENNTSTSLILQYIIVSFSSYTHLIHHTMYRNTRQEKERHRVCVCMILHLLWSCGIVFLFTFTHNASQPTNNAYMRYFHLMVYRFSCSSLSAIVAFIYIFYCYVRNALHLF